MDKPLDAPFDSGQGMKVSNNPPLGSANVSASKHLVQRETMMYMLDATKLQNMSPFRSGEATRRGFWIKAHLHRKTAEEEF